MKSLLIYSGLVASSVLAGPIGFHPTNLESNDVKKYNISDFHPDFFWTRPS